MDIILNPHYPMLLPAPLTFVCGWLVILYRMNFYNTEWLPHWIRPEIDIVDVPYPYSYPANELRTGIQGTDAKADRGEKPDIQELGRKGYSFFTKHRSQ